MNAFLNREQEPKMVKSRENMIAGTESAYRSELSSDVSWLNMTLDLKLMFDASINKCLMLQEYEQIEII